MTKKIAVLAGDGIGPEIVAEAMKVLDVLRDFGFKFEAEHAPIGGAGYDAAGDPLPDASLKLAQQADAVLLGAGGGPKYDTLPRDKRPERGLLRIRMELNLFAILRPSASSHRAVMHSSSTSTSSANTNCSTASTTSVSPCSTPTRSRRMNNDAASRRRG